MKVKNDKTNKGKPLVKSSNTFPVVGIGASAGGLEAFKKLLKAIPENSGIAYVLVQHLHPHHESMLPELLQKVTTIPISEITDDIKVVPNHIYVIPNNKLLIANDGILQLGPRLAENRNMTIDLFFTSLAEVHQSHAIGVVLSGTASDGTQGLKSIKEHGGLTFAQDDATAAYGSMPASAVEAGVVDFVLPPDQIPEKLMEITHRINGNNGDGPLPDEDVFKQILLLLRIRKGTDFTYYKQTTIRRRILRRMILNKNEEVGAYLNFLRENRAEQDVLYQDLLIPITGFFRDTQTFDNLCRSVFPGIVKNKMTDEPVRIWVAGCSTGEEVYSIAICFKEGLGDQAGKLQIFGSDISEPAILKARAGSYSKSDVDAVSPQRLKEFFTKINDGYNVKKELREMCVFAMHNFLRDPPFGKMDIISCRNVLIYLEPYLQKKALTTFHYALNPKGFLLLGKSETASMTSDLFVTVDRSAKLFTRKDGQGKSVSVTSRKTEENLRDTNLNVQGEMIRTDFQKSADDIMLSKYTPAGVVVNEAMEIVHFRGSTGLYLEPAPGKPSLNLLKMAKNGLGFELRSILHKAKKEKAAVVKENISLNTYGNQRIISIEAIPLPNIVEPYYLILFHDNLSTGIKHTSARTGAKDKRKAAGTKKSDKELIEQLEKELSQTREDMRSITEDQEAANEELQSANEELFSSGEELQSLNEELETSKEELQSTVEELTVLNQEMTTLNEQLNNSKDYAETIIATIREPLMVLDKDLRIKTANKSFYRVFKVNERDTEGKSIYEVGDRQWDIPQLRKLLEAILPEKESFCDFEVEYNFPTIGYRSMLLNASEMINKSGSEKLVLVSFEDITEAKASVRKIAESEKRYSMILMESPFAFAILKGHEMVITLANDAIKKIWGKGINIEGKPILQVLPEIKDQQFPTLLDKVYTTGIPFYAYEILAQIEHNGEVRDMYFNLIYQPYRESDETISGVTVIANEVTSQAELNRKIKESEANFRQLAELTPEKVNTADSEGNINYYNKSWLDYTGKNKEELTNLAWDEIVHPDDRQEFINRWKHCIATGDDLEMELRFLSKTGEYKWHLGHSVAIKNDEGKITKWIGTNTEIQQQKELTVLLEKSVADKTSELSTANQTLTQRNVSLQKLNAELDSFNYVSSHDLQEPLRKIQTFASKILEKEQGALSGKGQDYFRRIQDSAKRMQTLIQDLLSYSRTTHSELKLIKTDLTGIVERVKNDLEEIIREKNATIEIHDLGELNIIPFQFHQMMHNLIGNALKFCSAQRPPHVIIKSEIIQRSKFQKDGLTSEKNYCHIIVSDNGVGFESKYNERIFEMFQRLYGQDEYPGTGIGLSIVKKIVENHNGLITASSKSNEGATFDIYIPCDQKI